MHGVDIGRKPPRRATHLSGTELARNWRYRQWIRSLPCAACGLEPCHEAAHTGCDGGMSVKASDYSAIPLCSECHTLGIFAYHRIGRQEFERRYRLDIGSLVRRLHYLWFALGQREAC